MVNGQACKQKRDRYEMHKYWGKKPSSDLSGLIDRYTNVGDVVLDPFSGYGVFSFEAYSMGRNSISNDLNPMASNIQTQLFSTDVNFSKLESEYRHIVIEMTEVIEKWYGVQIGEEVEIATTVLRDASDSILKCRYTNTRHRGAREYEFCDEERRHFRVKEESSRIQDWYPDVELIENSRISAKKGMRVSDLFTKRTLLCHARLFSLINRLSTGPERQLLLLAFTANLANCSRLVPPIKTRGDMAQGAWMTGYYTGATYLENNVMHYFSNRYRKIVKGKRDCAEALDLLAFSAVSPIGEVGSVSDFTQDTCGYFIMSEDAKTLSLPSDSVDYVFTDPPYGDSVPYFEQSLIWNAWMSYGANYENEIVVSNSPKRSKDMVKYVRDISMAISEIFRILRTGKHFSVTFHSLSGEEWAGLTNACIDAGFEFCSFHWLKQKTFTPRQINRSKTIKGDILLTFRKTEVPRVPGVLTANETREFYRDNIRESISRGIADTNGIFMEIVKAIFESNILLSDSNFFITLGDECDFIDEKWVIRNG